MQAIEDTLTFKLNPDNRPSGQTDAECRRLWTRNIFEAAPNPRALDQAALNAVSSFSGGLSAPTTTK